MQDSESGSEMRCAFWAQLGEWLAELGETQRWLAYQIDVSPSTLNRWWQMAHVPEVGYLVRLVDALHRAFGNAWGAAEALDWVALLGVAWADVDTACEGELVRPRKQPVRVPVLDKSERQVFRAWWVSGRPPACAWFWEQRLPVYYTQRSEGALLVAQFLQLTTYRQPRWRAIVIHGVSGSGKTTLVQGLGQVPRLCALLRDGWLWNAGGRVSPAQWCAMLFPGKLLPAEWDVWASDPARRAVLVLDDFDVLADWESVLGVLGPQVQVVVTTQQPADAVRVLSSWFPLGQISQLQVGGMSAVEGKYLAEALLGDRLTEDQTDAVQVLGERVGWHPEALRLGILAGAIYGWADVLALGQDTGLTTALSDRLTDYVERLPEVVQASVLTLLSGLLAGTQPEVVTFGRVYAAAVWKTTPELATGRLKELAHWGVLERLSPDDDLAYPLWRVASVVAQTLRDKVPSLPRGLVPLITRYGRSEWRAPASFLVAALLWWGLNLPRELAGGQRAVFRTSEAYLYALWSRRGGAPPVEFWVLHAASQDRLRYAWGLLLGACVGLVLALFFALQQSSVASWVLARAIADYAPWLALAWVLASLLPLAMLLRWVAWLTWLYHQFGVEQPNLPWISRLAHYLQGLRLPFLRT